MTVQEIRELLELKNWSQVELSKHLQMHEATVSKWLSGERPAPTGPACILMRQWLSQAKEESRKQPA